MKHLNTAQKKALAFMAITGTDRGLHVRTRITLFPFRKMNFDGIVGSPLFTITDEGMEIVEKTKLWKAHQWLTAHGFKIRKDRVARKGFIPYTGDLKTNNYGRAFALRAFISSNGDIYVDAPDTAGISGSGWVIERVTV